MLRKSYTALLTVVFAFTSLSIASTWDLDKAHSSIEFKIKHLMITNVRGSFDSFTGHVDYDENDVTKSKVEVTIDVASINTGNQQRDDHLRSADFFDVEKYPKMTFVSKKIHKADGGLKVTGDLTLHGVTKEVILNVEGPTAPVKGPMGNMRMGATATTKIDRRDFGLTWSKALETGGLVVDNKVMITLEVELIKSLDPHEK